MEGLLNFNPSRNGKNGGSIYSFNSKSKSRRSTSIYNKSNNGKGRESVHSQNQFMRDNTSYAEKSKSKSTKKLRNS